jgi:tetratricopeptide (TPR) repeat protein
MEANECRSTLYSLLLCLALPALGQVSVREDILSLPTYQEALPDTTPPFPLFSPGDPQVYPYTMRNGFTKRRLEHGWRALRLENEYLSCIVLPDLGGHLYSCKDKLNGQEMFHANPSVKKAPVGLRGSWVAMGIEMNFPVGHTWSTVSPVDFATVQNPDGSASIWVGDIDRVDEMQWRVEFVLRPGTSVLEQNVYFDNRSEIRHRYYWWNNAGIARVDDKTRFIYPTHLVATHGRTTIDTWPVNSAGVDMSVVGNHKDGGVALFAHESHEPFMAVYHPSLRTGTVHYADVKQVPGKKVWSWGRESNKWAAAELSDNNTSYLEMQAGLFENQETYEFLEAGETRKFSEYWMPIRELGGVSRANLEGVLNLARSPDQGGRIQLVIEVNANHKIPGAKLRIMDGANAVFEESATLDPAVTFTKILKGLVPAPQYTFQLLDGAGQVLLTHTENQYDALTPKDVKLGAQTASDPGQENLNSASGFLKLGQFNELQGHPVFARSAYRQGLQRFPDDAELNRAMARLDLTENRWENSVKELTRVKTSAADDGETRYYLGVAYADLGDDAKARPEFESVSPQQPLHAAASIALAGLLARAQDYAGALKSIEGLLAAHPGMLRAGEMEVALLRRLGQPEKARQRLVVLRLMDPTNSVLRYEQARLGQDDPALWRHLGADPERVLNLAVGYLDLGLYDEALALLSRKYPSPVDILAAEPGAVLPQNYPLVGYYRAYCMMKLGLPPGKDLDEASAALTEYVFPSRPSTFSVLRYALQQNPSDATALFLLGELYLASEDVDQGIGAWQQARTLGFRRPELYRDLGRTLLDLKKDAKSAMSVYQEGLKIASSDPELKKGLQGVYTLVTGSNLATGTNLATGSNPLSAPSGGPMTSIKSDLSSPQAAAKYALGLLGDEQLDDAAAVFQAANFPAEKQDQFVREAYIEIQVQRIAALARGKRCTDAITAEDHLGDEDPDLPFTFHGFGPILKGLRVQYDLAGLEAQCGREKDAKKIWAKLAKSSKDVSDPDFVVPILAAARIESAVDLRARIDMALEQVRGALNSSSDRSTLLYSQGMLLRTVGREGEAQKSLGEALASNPPGMVGYLALRALREK